MYIIFNVLSLLAGCYILYYHDMFVIFILGQKVDIWFLIVPLFLSFFLIFVRDFFVKKFGVFGNIFILSLNVLISFFIGGLAFKVAASYMVFREKIINNFFFVLKRIKWSEEEYLERARFLLWNREGTEGLNLNQLYNELKPKTMEEWDLQLEILVKKIRDDLLDKKLKLLEAKLHNVENQVFLLNNKPVVEKGTFDTFLYDYVLDPKIWVVVGLIGFGYAVYSGMFNSKISTNLSDVDSKINDTLAKESDKIPVSETIPVPEKGVLSLDVRMDILESEYDKLVKSIDNLKVLTDQNSSSLVFSKMRFNVIDLKFSLLAIGLVDLFAGSELSAETKMKTISSLMKFFEDKNHPKFAIRAEKYIKMFKAEAEGNRGGKGKVDAMDPD